MMLARRAPHRWRACDLQSQRLCLSRFTGNRGGWRGETRDLERFHSAKMWKKESARQIACDMVRPGSTIATADYHAFRYCIPMDGQRPSLNLRFYKNICPDQNGASSWTVRTVFNAIILSSSRPRSVHQIWPVPAQCRNGCVRLPW